jgi:hypothetical protein
MEDERRKMEGGRRDEVGQGIPHRLRANVDGQIIESLANLSPRAVGV